MGRSKIGPTADPFLAAVAAAEVSQQRAERKRGLEALPVYEKAVGQFEAALKLAPHPPNLAAIEASINLGECLQNWGETTLSAASALPDDVLTCEVEAEAQTRACALFRRAVHAYGAAVPCDQPSTSAAATPCTAPSTSAAPRADVAVNCANTLASWAEAAVEGQEGPRQLLAQALHLYRAALSSEPDALTWGNLADAEVATAVAAAGDGDGAAAEACAERARAAYATACQLSSTDNGDDLPGLLANWGTGLVALAGLMQDSATKLATLEEAVQRLRESASFDRADPAPLCALGDAFVAAAEADADGPATLRALCSALEDGYGAALRVDARHAEARAGAGDARMALARALTAGGDEAAGQEALRGAEADYGAALARPERLGGWRERADVRYNLACCLARQGRAEEARQLLGALIASGAVAEATAREDADLAGLWQQA
uniref:Uncharacterized protein n=2 Tax=Auxenochlorella protothecoides TaxID=3075 RepID=A0A1D2A0Q6_AUXPR